MSSIDSRHHDRNRRSSAAVEPWRPPSALDDHEREVAVLRAVLTAITAWSTFEQGSERLLREFAGGLGQMAAAFWVPDHDRLVMKTAWSMAGVDGEVLTDKLGGLGVRRGSGLVGCAWERREAIDGSSLRPRRPSRRGGSPKQLVPTLAIPCCRGEAVLAVVELYSVAKPELSSHLMEVLTRAGGHLGAFLSRRRGELGLSPLSPRELQVLTLAGQGLPAQSIAESLSISAPTVKTHFEHIYRKLPARDRTAAVAHALRAGLIE